MNLSYWNCQHDINRQYLITSDETDPNSKSTNKGFQIHELILTIPPDNFQYNCSARESLPYLISEKEYLSQKDFCSYYNPMTISIDAGKTVSKMSQTSYKNKDQAVNVSVDSVCSSTQTTNENYLTVKNMSGYNSHNSYNSRTPPVDTEPITHIDKIVDILDDESSRASNSENNNGSSEKDSIIFTYSINKSVTTNNSNNESNLTESLSNSIEDISDNSNSVVEDVICPKSSSKASLESDIFRLLNNESNENCIRVSYIPAEMISNQNRSSSDIWDHYRVFELKKFDEIIKSHQVRSDRRLKAISNRMLCKIDIIGPYQTNYSQMNLRNAMEWYNLIVYANNKLRLEKSINCIQLSFPSSCFNEKLYKTTQSLLRY